MGFGFRVSRFGRCGFQVGFRVSGFGKCGLQVGFRVSSFGKCGVHEVALGFGFQVLDLQYMCAVYPLLISLHTVCTNFCNSCCFFPCSRFSARFHLRDHPLPSLLPEVYNSEGWYMYSEEAIRGPGGNQRMSHAPICDCRVLCVFSCSQCTDCGPHNTSFVDLVCV